LYPILTGNQHKSIKSTGSRGLQLAPRVFCGHRDGHSHGQFRKRVQDPWVTNRQPGQKCKTGGQLLSVDSLYCQAGSPESQIK